jgi:hypothetical protein
MRPTLIYKTKTHTPCYLVILVFLWRTWVRLSFITMCNQLVCSKKSRMRTGLGGEKCTYRDIERRNCILGRKQILGKLAHCKY